MDTNRQTIEIRLDAITIQKLENGMFLFGERDTAYRIKNFGFSTLDEVKARLDVVYDRS